MKLHWGLDGTLYVKHYNLWYKVIVIFTDMNQANKFMEENEGVSLLIEEGNAIVLVMKDDKGWLK